MKSVKTKSPGDRLSIFLTWCKRCGNCIAFCPRGALAGDEWGYPFLAEPQKCTACGLCEMLCPDFALSVNADDEPLPDGSSPAARSKASTSTRVSPERVAGVPRKLED